jgi:Uma2 family endonuclease
MAVLPIPPILSVDEYLNSSYRPDMEYVDGVLVERGMPTIAHGLLQIILGSYLRTYRKQFRFVALTEVRTQIIERARYRILVPIPKV